MPNNNIATGVNIGDPVGFSTEHYDIGVEAQNVIVSYDIDGNIIEDINETTPASTKPLSLLLKESPGSYYGSSSTAEDTAAKIVTVSSSQHFSLRVGTIIGIAFENTNIAEEPTINVNGSGAKRIYKGTSVQSYGDAGIVGGTISFFQYNGTYWIWMCSSATTGGGGGGGGGHVIQNNAGSNMPQEDTLQFKSVTVTDANGKTIVEVAPVMTAAQYEALSQAQKMDGTIRFISDGVGTLKSFGVEQTLTDGVEIGAIIINGARTPLYAPDIDNLIQVRPTLNTGTEIGTITVDGVPYTLYGPRAVSVDRVLNSGTEIAGITIGGSRTAIFAPDNGKWSEPVSANTGSTYCTIYDNAIRTTSSIDVYYQKSGSGIVYLTGQTVATGRITVYYDALTEPVSFKARIFN